MTKPTVTASIKDWAVTPEYIQVTAGLEPFHLKNCYQLRIHLGKGSRGWGWYQKAATGHFTAFVNAETMEILDDLVQAHPVLCLLLQNGYGYD